MKSSSRWQYLREIASPRKSIARSQTSRSLTPADKTALNEARFRSWTIHNFEPLRDEVVELLNELDKLKSPNAHPRFIGGGTNARAFRLSDRHPELVVRVPTYSRDKSAVDERLATYAKAHGLPGNERLVASSDKLGVTVSLLAPGPRLGSLDAASIDQITEKHIAAYLQAGNSRLRYGVKTDPSKLGNFCFSPEAGITAIDLGDEGEPPRPLADVLIESIEVLANNDGCSTFTSVADEFASDAERARARVRLMERVGHVVDGLGDEALRDALSQSVKRCTADLSDTVEMKSDPGFLAQEIARRERSTQLQAKGLDTWSAA